MRLAGKALPHTYIVSAEHGYFAQYEIIISTWAGRTTLSLEDGENISLFSFQVKPNQNKLGQDEFDEMLHELARRQPGLIWGLSPGGQSGSLSKSSPAVVHPAVVKSQLPLLDRLLSLFIADPPLITLKSRDPRPLDLTRRVDLRTLRWLSRRPLLLSAIRGSTDGDPYVDLRTPIDQPKTDVSIDHPITRYFIYLLHRLIERLCESSRLLKEGPKRQFRDPSVECHARALAISLDDAALKMRNILGKSPFRALRPEPPTATVLQLLGDHPLFGAINRCAQMLLAPGLAYGPTGDVYASLKHTYDLFELFVLFRIIEFLKEALGPAWTLEAHKSCYNGGREDRPPDRSVWLFRGPDDTTLEVRYQQWFSRMKCAEDGRTFTSLSGVNIPDYVLLVRKRRIVTSWVLLDAKYRSRRQAVDDGLGDIHRYRDALRVRGTRADGAFVVVPKLQEENALYSTSDYHEIHGFGVLQLFSKFWLRPALNALGLR